ncbi:MAG: hypothetical protein ACRCV9_19105 [Burkholderiaceae bacterium]
MVAGRTLFFDAVSFRTGANPIAGVSIGGQAAVLVAAAVSGQARTEHWVVDRFQGGANTDVVITWGAAETSGFVTGAAQEWDALPLNSLLTAAQASGTGTAISVTSGVNQTPNARVSALWVAVAGDANIGSSTPASTGFTSLFVEQDSVANQGGEGSFKTVSTSQAQSASWTRTLSASWAASVAAFALDGPPAPPVRNVTRIVNLRLLDSGNQDNPFDARTWAGQVRASKWFLPELDQPASGGGGSINLTVANATVATRLSAPALTQNHALLVQNLTVQTQLSEPAITVSGGGDIALMPANAVVQTQLGSVTIEVTQEVTKNAGGIRRMRWLDADTPQNIELRVADAVVRTELSVVRVTQNAVLKPENMRFAVDLAAVAIEQRRVINGLFRHPQGYALKRTRLR